MLGVTKLVPVPMAVPPEAAVNQLIVAPEEALAPRVTVPVPHLLPGVLPVTVGKALIVAKTGTLAEVQAPEVAST